MARNQVVQGQCSSCGKESRVLMPPEQDGQFSCIVCALLTTIQQMTTRVDSESDHRIVRLYQDLQAAAQRFWSTPQTMNYHFSIVTAFDLSTHPTPILPTTTTSTSHADTPTDEGTLPPIIPPARLVAYARDPNLGCPHRTTALAPSIIVDTPIYNLIAPGTEEQTRHFAQIGISTNCYLFCQ